MGVFIIFIIIPLISFS